MTFCGSLFYSGDGDEGSIGTPLPAAMAAHPCVLAPGDLLVLDGVHRLRNDTLHALHSLIYDRVLPLPDGSEVLPTGRFDRLAATGAVAVVSPGVATRADGSKVCLIDLLFVCLIDWLFVSLLHSTR